MIFFYGGIFLKKLSLAARQSILTIMLGFVPFVVVMLCGFSYLSDISRREQLTAQHFSLQSIATTLDYIISNYDETSQYIIGNDAVRTFLKCSAPVNSAEYLSAANTAMNALLSLPFTTSPGQTCAIFSMSGNRIYRGATDQISITPEEIARCESLNGRWFWSIDKDSLSICRLLRDKEWVANRLGYLKIQIQTDTLLPLLSTLPELNGISPMFLLYDMDIGGVLLDNLSDHDSAWLMSQLNLNAVTNGVRNDFHIWRGSDSYSVLTRVLKDGHSTLIATFPDSAAQYRQMKITIFASAFALSVLLTAIQILIFRHLVAKPLNKLGSLMSSVEHEEYGVSFHIRGHDEISDLAARFNSMSTRLEHLHRQVYQSELSMRAAEIRILEKEINPHFFFNTLDTIYWTIQVGNADKAAEMIQDLSSLFRLSLYRSTDDLVPLDTELAHMQCYLALEKMRMGSALEYSLDIQPGLEGIKVIKLILQPLIENAIVHGIVPQESGEISISIYTDGNCLCYLVYDNGVGADPEVIERILHTPPKDGSTHGIALRNVNERIQLKFGESFGVSYRLPADGGSAFIVRQPLIGTPKQLSEQTGGS